MITIVGRSSSHYTRILRIFALELEVAHDFRPVFDIMSLDANDFGGNPTLKIPSLIDEEGALFGTENCCRALIRRSGKGARVVMRGDLGDRTIANAEELVLSAMSTEVSLIMAKASGAPTPPKPMKSIEGTLRRLDDELERTVAALPADRMLSFVETSLFCLITHLPFREVMDVAPFARLEAFARTFGERPSARATEYRYDKK